MDGVYVIEPERRVDRRGSFERMYCRREYAEHRVRIPDINDKQHESMALSLRIRELKHQ